MTTKFLRCVNLLFAVVLCTTMLPVSSAVDGLEPIYARGCVDDDTNPADDYVRYDPPTNMEEYCPGVPGSIPGVPESHDDVPEDEMDSTNRGYLENGTYRAKEQANETVAVVDELVSAAITGNVTQALNVLYNYTPIGGPLRNTTQMVEMAQDAILNLVKCSTDVDIAPPAFGPGPTIDLEPAEIVQMAQEPTVIVEAIRSSDPPNLDPDPIVVPELQEDPVDWTLQTAGTANDTANCMTQVLLPFLDALLGRTLEAVSPVTDLVAQVQNEVLPSVVGTADALLPIELQATTQALLERPVETVLQTALDLPAFASDPQNLQEAVAETEAAVDLQVAQILKPSSRHPQFLYDFTHNDITAAGVPVVPGGIPIIWEEVVVANQAAGQNSGGRVDVIATVDSTVFNLYTNRAGAEKITGVPVGKRTCIQLDATTSTRDASGCDLYATMAVATTLAPTSAGSPSTGTRFTPTITIEKAHATANYGLEALGYLQLPNTPYVVVLGYNTNVTGNNPGLPAKWEATLHDYDSAETTNRSFAFSTSYTDTRGAIPLKLVAAAFGVNENLPNKPVAGDNETILEATSSSMAKRISIDLRRNHDTGLAQAVLELTTLSAMPLDVAYHDVVATRDALMEVHARNLPIGLSKAVATYQSEALTWSWATLANGESGAQGGSLGGDDDVVATMGPVLPDDPELATTWPSPGGQSDGSTSGPPIMNLDLGYIESFGSTPKWVYQVNATALPSSLVLQSNAALHRHDYQANPAPGSFQFLVSRDSDSCPRLDVGAVRHVNFERISSRYCMAGQLAGYKQITLDSTNLMAHAAGTRATSDAQGTAFQVKDGNTVFLHSGNSPSTWDAELALAGNQTQEFTWAAANPSSFVQFNADLDQGARRELMKAELTTVPTSVTTSLDLATGQGTLTASNYVGSTSLAFSTTGNAPTQTATEDYLRLRILGNAAAPDVESAWKTTGAKRLVTRVAPNGTLEVTGDYQALRPLSVRYHDAEHDLALDVSGLTGKFGYWLTTQAESGTLQFRQSASNAPSIVDLVARMPGGRIDIDLVNAPNRLAIAAYLANQTASIAGSGVVGHADVRYATNELAPTAGDGNAIVLQDSATGNRGAAFQLDNARRILATRITDRLTIDTTFAAPSELRVHMEDATGAVELALDKAPTHADIQYPEGGLTWASNAASTDFQLQAALEAGPRFIEAAATSAPSQISASWTTRAADSLNATLIHSGTSLAELAITDFRGKPTATSHGSGWTFHATALPARSNLHFEPVNAVATASFRTAAGAASAVGRVETAFSQLTDSLPSLVGSSQGLWMRHSGRTTSAILVADGLRALDAPLLVDAGQPNASPHLVLDRSLAGSFDVWAASDAQAAQYSANLVSAAPKVQIDVRVGSTAAEGFNIALANSAASGPFMVRLERDGLDLALATTGSTPQSMAASWNAEAPTQVTASTPVTLAVQSADELATVPGVPGDYLTIRWTGTDNGQPRFGMHLTDISSFTADVTGRRLVASGGPTATGFVMDYDDLAQHLAIEVSDLGPQLTVSWTSANSRAFQVSNTGPIELLRLQATPASDASPRLLLGLSDAPSGTTAFSQAANLQSFSITAPSPIGRVWVSADQGGLGAMKVLTEYGALMDASVTAKPFQLNLPNLRSAEGSLATAPPHLVVDSTGVPGPLRLKLNGTTGEFTGTASMLPPGVARFEWPYGESTISTGMRFSASGVAGSTVGLAAVLDRDYAQATVQDGPSSWSFSSTYLGAVDYVGSGPAASVKANGLHRGAAHKLEATSAPNEMHAAPAVLMLTGSVTATGPVGRLKLALAPAGAGSSGQLPAPSIPGTDLFTVDTAAGPGTLFVDLPAFKGASWSIPPGARDDVGAALRFVTELAAPTSRPATFQAVHPDHQTRIDFPAGLPTKLDTNLAQALAQWTLASTMATPKDMQVQHQDANYGSLLAQFTGSGTLTAAPKANRAVDWNGAASPVVMAQTSWNQGYVDVNVTDAPARFVVDGNALKTGIGSISTLGTGATAHARAFLVPDAGQTANRVTSNGDYAAVELLGKTPYAAINVEDFEAFSWNLPDATSQAPLAATLSRDQPTPGQTLVVLSGTREDVTANLINPAATLGFTVYQSANAPGAVNPAPVTVGYTSTGGSTDRVDLTHVDADTGQALTSYIIDASGTTNLEATGAEPARISIVAQNNQGGIGIKTTDLGTALNLQVTGLTSRLTAEVQRGTCGATSPDALRVTTHGTGTTGPAIIQIGDQGKVPQGPSGNYVAFQCDGKIAAAGARLPFVKDMAMTDAPCGGLTITGIPANSPTPIYAADTNGTYAIRVASDEGGFLTLALGCDKVAYWFNSTFGAPARVSLLELGYQRLDILQNVTRKCIEVDGHCMDRLNVKATSMPPTATATFKGPGGGDGFQLKGGNGGKLDVRILLNRAVQSAKEESEESNIVINSAMQLDELRFLKSDNPDVDSDGSTPNQILHRSSSEENTLFIKLDRPDRITATIATGEDCFFQLGVDYAGRSHRALEFFGESDDSKMIATASSLPGQLKLDVVHDGFLRNFVQSELSSDPIGNIRFAKRLSTCGGDGVPLDLFAAVNALPAGPWTVGARFGAAGYVKAKSEGGFIGGVDVGLAAPGHPERYVSLHLNDARLGLEWDFDGSTQFPGNPYYIFCDTGGGQSYFSIRARFDDFGVGVGLDKSGGIEIGCNDLQISWHYEVLGLCDVSCLVLPWFKVNGGLSVAIQAPLPVAEVLYAGKWWSIPNKLVIV